MAKKQAKSTQETLSLSGEALWAELEKIGFYGANLRAQAIATPTPWEFVDSLVSVVMTANGLISRDLGEVYVWVIPEIETSDWKSMLEFAATEQSANLELRRRIREAKD